MAYYQKLNNGHGLLFYCETASCFRHEEAFKGTGTTNSIHYYNNGQSSTTYRISNDRLHFYTSLERVN